MRTRVYEHPLQFLFSWSRLGSVSVILFRNTAYPLKIHVWSKSFVLLLNIIQDLRSFQTTILCTILFPLFVLQFGSFNQLRGMEFYRDLTFSTRCIHTYIHQRRRKGEGRGYRYPQLETPIDIFLGNLPLILHSLL